MASTRELWILLRARDEASRVVSSFSKNVRAAALAAQAAQKSAEAAAIRQQAQMLKTNGTTATQIRAVNDHVVALEKQARANTMAAAKAREFRAEQMKGIDSQLRSNNVHASSLERQAKAFTLLAATADQNREALLKHTGVTEENARAIDNQISMARKRAATLNAEASVIRGASASLVAGLQKEQTGLDGSIRSYERRAAAIRAQAAVARNAAQEMKINLDTQVRSLTNQASALDRQANALRQSANAAREHDIRHRRLIDTMGKVSEAATVAAFSLGAIGVGGLVGLKNAIDVTVAYENQVRATATQVDGFGADLKELGDIGRRVANQIAVPFESIQPALFDIFSSMEVGVEDAEKLLTAFSKAAVAGQTDIQAVSRATIGILNAFGRPAKDVTKILDMQFQLIQEGIGTYEEWNQRIGLVTPSAVRFGQSIEMMMAALATATRTGTSAARSATAVSRAMDALSHPAAVKNLKELGVAVQDAKGKFRPMNDILREFRAVLMKMPEKDRLAAILDVFKGAGGTIEARRFLQNMLLGKNSLEIFDNVLGETEKSAGSLEKAYGIMADSTAAKTELLRNKWMLLKEAIGQALLPAFNDLIDRMQVLLDWFNKLPEGTKGAIAQFLLWGSVLTIVLGAMFAFMGIAAVFVAALGTIGISAALTIGALALLPVVLLAIGLAFIAAYNNSQTFRDMVSGLGDTLKELWGIVTDTAAGIKESFDTHVLPALKRLADAFEQKVLPPARKFADMVKNEFMPKLQEASRIIQEFADGALKRIGEVIDDKIIPAMEKLGGWWDKNGEKIKPMIEMLAQAVKWVLILGAVITGILVVALMGPLVAAIAIAVAAFQTFWFAVTKISDKAKETWANLQKLPGVFSAIGSSIGSFFSGIGQTIATAFQSVLGWFQQLPEKIMGFLTSLPGKVSNLFTNTLNQAAYAVGFGLGLVYRYFTEVVPKVGMFLMGLPGTITRIFNDARAKALEKALSLVNGVANFLKNLPLRASEAISSLWSKLVRHFESAKTGASNKGRELVDGTIKFLKDLPSKAATAIGTIHQKILGAFAGAAGWLLGAGEDIVRGVIKGIGNMIGGGVDAARNAAKKMVQGFKDAIRSKSPSKVFMDIGYNIVRGLIIGITGTRKQLMNAMDKLAHDVTSSLNAGKASKSLKASWSKRLASDSKKLLSLESKRATINAKIAAAQKSLNDQMKARAELSAKITEKLSSAADIVSLKGSDPTQIKADLEKRLKDLQDFQQGLIALRSMGMNAQSISELAQAGVDGAGELVKGLAKGTTSDIQQINAMQRQIRAIAGSVGNSTASQMYDAGINAAKGLIKGLQSQSAAITKEMTKIANSLISAIKKSLGIKSPSKVFEGIGINTALGYIQGYRKQMLNAPLHAEMLAMARPRPGFTAAVAGAGVETGRTFYQTINITTNEIDPRRNAAELGYELEGRLR